MDHLLARRSNADTALLLFDPRIRYFGLSESIVRGFRALQVDSIHNWISSFSIEELDQAFHVARLGEPQFYHACTNGPVFPETYRIRRDNDHHTPNVDHHPSGNTGQTPNTTGQAPASPQLFVLRTPPSTATTAAAPQVSSVP